MPHLVGKLNDPGSKQVFSYAAIVGGTILAMKGFDTLGYFIIGGGLYQVAPGYMRAIINKYKTEEKDDDSKETNAQ